MKLLFTAVLFLAQQVLAQQAVAGTWTSLDEKTLKFAGKIAETEYSNFLKTVLPTHETLIVTSGGGFVGEAAQIAMHLQTQGLKEVVVEGRCMSSCANYLFLSAPKKVIREKSFVAYHGNATSSVFALNLPSLDLKEFTEGRMTLEQYNERLRTIGRQVYLEQILSRMTRVNQAFFEFPGRDVPDEYDWWVPSLRSFRRFGIKGVQGDQDVEAAVKAGLKVYFK
jgi:hypothetical protein